MDFGAYILFFAVLSAITCNTEGTVCKTDSECGSGECCYIKPAFEVVSRRRQASILPVQPTQHHTGVCESYRVEHEHCGPLEQANGHCGCGAGMSCQFVPAEIATVKPLQVVSKKRKIYVPGPGTFQCEKTS
ncbi:uncharacterized protein LOC123523563 [Mercenaria mercenaria]|uniref:uncharacterized protein LOC123523563 n=1 Tax=Mercenaria mercenaria TaxID=6596 RepID=UPI00234F77DE|nr:uncharacterized protein LOC123523563 [Mercenaria mercenaria]